MAKIPFASQQIDVIDPETREVVDSFSTAGKAYQAGILSNPTLSGLLDKSNVYQIGTTGWTTKEPTTSSISLDKATGDINIVVPKSVADTPSFQSSLDMYKSYSSNYKQNPKAEYAVTNSNGEQESISLETFISRLNTPVDTGEKDEAGNAIAISPFQSEVNQVIWANSVRDFIGSQYQQIDENGNVSNVYLSDTDIVRMTTNGLGKDAKDTARLALPKGWQELREVYADADWSDALGDISIKKFKDIFYNREKTDQQTILSLYGRLGRYLQKAKQSATYIDDVDTEEWTGVYALYTFLSETDPTCSMFRGAWDTIGALVNAAGQSFVDYTVLGTQVVANVAEKVYDVTQNIMESGLSEHTFDDRDDTDFNIWAKTVNDVMDTKWWAQYWGYGVGEFEKASRDKLNLERIQQDVKSLMGIGVDEETATRLRTEGPTPQLNSTADAVRSLGTTLMELGIAIHVGNVLEGVAKNALSGAAAKIASGATSIEKMVGTGTKAWVAIMGGQGVASVFNVVAKAMSSPVASAAIGLVGESIGEAIFQSPQVLSQILQSDELDAEAQAYLWDTYTGNAFALIATSAGGKALKAAGKTAWGKAISSNLQNKLYSWQGKVADAFDGLRIKLAGVDNEAAWLEKIGSKGLTDASRSRHAQKAMTMAQTRTLRRIREAIAENSPTIKWIGESKDSILKQLDEAEDVLSGMMNYENALDDLLRGNIYRKLQIYEDNPLLDASQKRLNNLVGDIASLQAQAGLKTAEKVGRLELFAPEVNKYINAKTRVVIGEQTIAAKRLSKAVNATQGIDVIEKEIVHWRGVVESFEKNYSATLVSKANEFIGESRKWWEQFNDFQVREGLIDQLDIERLRSQGNWGDHGELYVRQQRTKEMSDYILSRRDGKATRELTRDFGHYNWGSTDEFVDPVLVMQNEIEIAAERLNRVQATRTYSQITGTATKVSSAEDVRVSKQVKPLLSQYNDEANAAIKPLVSEMDVDGLFKQSIERQRLSAAKATTRRTLSQYNNSIYKRAITKGEAQIAVLDMDDDALEQLWESAYGGRTIEDVTGITKSDTISIRTLLLNSAEARSCDYMKEVVIPAREASIRQTIDYASLATAEKNIEVLGERMDDVLDNIVTDTMSDFKETFFAKGSAANRVANEIAMRYGGDAPDAVTDFLYYDSLKKNKANIAKQVKDKAKKYFQDYETEVDGKKIKPYKGQAEQLANGVSKRVSARVEAEFNASRAAVASMGGDAARLIDYGSWQREVYDTAKEIVEISKGDNVIVIPNELGQDELVEVDPLLSIFVNSTSQYTPMGALGKANYLWMRLFRLGTTGMNPTSWVNQTYRDLGNAWVMGNITDTLRGATAELAGIFGEDAGQFLSQYSEQVQDNLLKLAKEQNKSISQVMAEREIRRGAMYSQSTSETELTRLWRGTKNQWYANSGKRGGWDKTMDTFDKVEAIVTKPNELRETQLRNIVYGNNFAAAIKNGKSITQARTFAEYIASNATTNFTRGVAFMNQFQNTIPYFRSAINGTRSFYRLWSLDPVGVTGRLVGGIILPAFSLTMMSLSTEENRKTYKKIQAYQKEDSLPIVMNGEAFFIPLPQELSAFVAPYRQAAEAICGLGYNNALEVTMNDLLALSPVDLGGFTDIDSWRIYGEGPSWVERLTSGGAQLFSQIMPKWATAAATALSGYDLYTGNKIDTSYVTVDPDTGAAEVMSYTAGAVAMALNKVFPGLAAPIAQEMMENVFGVAGVQVLDFFADIVGQTVSGDFNYLSAGEELASDVLNDITKPMRPYIEARELADWRHEMAALYTRKNNILSPNTPEGQAWQSMLTNQRNATTQTERDAVATARANILDPFYDEAMSTVRRLIQADPSAFTPTKLASVISLFNFGSVGDTVNSAASASAEDLYKQSKYAAVSTMVDMGFPNTNTPSILGSVVYSQKTGESYISWNTPLQILDMEYNQYARGAIYAADIKKLLNGNGITSDSLSATWDEYYATNDKNKRKQIAVDWDTKVGLAIAPYIQQYGVEVVGNSNDVIDLLDGYLIIPQDYTKYNGKSTYNPKVNMQRGYAKQFINDIFKGAK